MTFKHSNNLETELITLTLKGKVYQKSGSKKPILFPYISGYLKFHNCFLKAVFTLFYLFELRLCTYLHA